MPKKLKQVRPLDWRQMPAAAAGDPSTYRFGEFTLDVQRGCLLRSGEEIRLRPKVYEALRYLVQNPGRLISKQELMQAIWPDSFVTDDSLVQCTIELRRALKDH